MRSGLRLYFLISLFFSTVIRAEPSGSHLSLAEANDRAKKTSAAFLAAKQRYESASFGEQSHNGVFFPKLDFGADYFYISEVPSMSLGGKKIDLASHNNYSIGPQLHYTLWDFGASQGVQDSLKHMTEAARWQLQQAEQELTLATKLAYVEAQVAQERVQLEEGALSLTTKQRQDIKERHDAGGASEVDYLTSETELESTQIRLFQEKSRHAQALTELASLIGATDSLAGITLDKLEQELVSRLEVSQDGAVDAHPVLKAAEDKMLGMRRQADSQQAGVWPTIQVHAKTSLDFPNGTLLEQVHQNTFGVSLNWTLFDWGMRKNLVSQKNAEAETINFELAETKRRMTNDLKKLQVSLDYLRKQRATETQLLAKVERLAKISYSSYEYGKLTLLEVFDTNLRLLEAKMRKVQNDGQILISLYRIEYLTSRGI